MALSQETKKIKLQKAIEREVLRQSKVHEKFIQAFNLRRKLLAKRIDAFERYHNNREPFLKVPLDKKEGGRNFREYVQDVAEHLRGSPGEYQKLYFTEELIKELSYCNRNEKRLMKALVEKEEVTLSALDIDKIPRKAMFLLDKELKKQYRIRYSSIKKISKLYEEIVSLFYKNYERVILRLQKEEDFLKESTFESFEVFLDLFSAEIKLQKRVEVKIDNLRNTSKAVRDLFPNAPEGAATITTFATMSSLLITSLMLLPGLDEAVRPYLFEIPSSGKEMNQFTNTVLFQFATMIYVPLFTAIGVSVIGFGLTSIPIPDWKKEQKEMKELMKKIKVAKRYYPEILKQ